MTDQAGWRERYGSAALVTGAASGIGAALVRELSRRGLEVVLVDRDAEGAERLAQEISGRGAPPAQVIAGDLLDRAFVEQVAGEFETRSIGLFVHCAGMYSLGPFVELPVEPQLAAIELHCRVAARFVHAAAVPMKRRGRGGIVLVSSNSALLRTPYVANYCATKAYLLTLAEALYEELRPHGIDVLGLVPGMTDTPLLAASRPDEGRAARIRTTPEQVAAAAVAALGEEPVCIPTVLDRVAAGLFGSLMPRRLSRFLAGRSMRYYYPQLGD